MNEGAMETTAASVTMLQKALLGCRKMSLLGWLKGVCEEKGKKKKSTYRRSANTPMIMQKEIYSSNQATLQKENTKKKPRDVLQWFSPQETYLKIWIPLL